MAFRGLGARFVKGIRGDYNNVVGLPVGRLYQELKATVDVRSKFETKK